MARIVSFDMPADDPAGLQRFYEKVFGWKFEKWEDPVGRMDYWFISTGKGEGIDGGMGKRTSPEDKVINTIGVKKLNGYMKKIEQNGGKILMPKMALAGVGWMASFEDPQGNIYNIMQEDRDAK